MPEREGPAIAILIPVFNDWAAVSALLPQLENALRTAQYEATVFLVDDASSEPFVREDFAARGEAILHTVVVSLRRNLGHQRAIAIGLALVHARFPHETVVVMDGDGQDRPEDVPRLVAEARRHDGTSIVFAERVRRSEGVVFALCYHLYRAAHLALTGERVRFGNFSAVPRACLERLVSVSELWGHYAAAIIRSRIPYVSIRTARARRIAGYPRMRFTGLVVHGLSALAIFSDVIGVRLLLASSGALVLLAVTFLSGFPGSFGAGVGRLGGTELFAISLMVLLLAFGPMLVFTFMILSSRQSSQFIPLRDYQYFILDVSEL